MLKHASESAVTIFCLVINWAVYFSLCEGPSNNNIFRVKVFYHFTWRYPLGLRIIKDGGGFFSFLGSIVRLDYDFCHSNHFTMHILNFPSMPGIITFWLICCRCHRFFYSNFSQSKHQYIPCRTNQLPKNDFLLLQNINYVYILTSPGT